MGVRKRGMSEMRTERKREKRVRYVMRERVGGRDETEHERREGDEGKGRGE